MLGEMPRLALGMFPRQRALIGVRHEVPLLSLLDPKSTLGSQQSLLPFIFVLDEKKIIQVWGQIDNSRERSSKNS